MTYIRIPISLAAIAKIAIFLVRNDYCWIEFMCADNNFFFQKLFPAAYNKSDMKKWLNELISLIISWFSVEIAI